MLFSRRDGAVAAARLSSGLHQPERETAHGTFDAVFISFFCVAAPEAALSVVAVKTADSEGRSESCNTGTPQGRVQRTRDQCQHHPDLSCPDLTCFLLHFPCQLVGYQSDVSVPAPPSFPLESLLLPNKFTESQHLA